MATRHDTNIVTRVEQRAMSNPFLLHESSGIRCDHGGVFQAAGNRSLQVDNSPIVRVGSIHEERSLAREFGRSYELYRRQVPRILPVPGRYYRKEISCEEDVPSYPESRR